MNMINENDAVILRRGKCYYPFRVALQHQIKLDRFKICLDGAVGHPFGSHFKVDAGQLMKVESAKYNADEVNTSAEPGADNRSLVDDPASQKLTCDEIQIMKLQGTSGTDIVDELVKNSATFAGKTAYSKTKYIKKKKDKYVAYVQVLRPTARLISEMMFLRSAPKINFLRSDSLAQMLSLSNVCAGQRVMVVDAIQSLLVASVVERVSGQGAVIHLHPGDLPSRQAMQHFGFSPEVTAVVKCLPLAAVGAARRRRGFDKTVLPRGVGESVGSEGEGGTVGEGDTVGEGESDGDTVPAKRQKLNDESDMSEPKAGGKDGDKKEKSAEALARKADRAEAEAVLCDESLPMDSLLIASKHMPSTILLSLVDFLAASRPFVVYCATKQPLVECYEIVKKKGVAVQLALSETWLREYQVLPDKTHPLINMSASSGYILSGITCQPREDRTSGGALQLDTADSD